MFQLNSQAYELFFRDNCQGKTDQKTPPTSNTTH